VGRLCRLWTVSSLIETIRDILRRSYGTQVAGRAAALSAAGNRHGDAGGGGAAHLALFAGGDCRGAGTGAHHPFARWLAARLLPAGADGRAVRRALSAVLCLTPSLSRRRYPKWPGALLVTLWWAVVSTVLPVLLRLFTYDLTYGSLAGVMIALFFFWLVGLGWLQAPN
jgi:membrane protein